MSEEMTLQVSVEASPVTLLRRRSTLLTCPPGLIEMTPQRVGELGVGGLLDHFGEGFDDLLLHVEGFLEVAGVEGTEIFDVRGKYFHWDCS